MHSIHQSIYDCIEDVDIIKSNAALNSLFAEIFGSQIVPIKKFGFLRNFTKKWMQADLLPLVGNRYSILGPE